MKKILSLLMVCFMALTLSAQRAAIMEFKAGVGISQADVDGLCGMFTTGFRPKGYSIIERSQIDRIISEQNMQRSSLTEKQMVRIGQLLNLSCIVIGDINVVMGEYNVDVRVINVESGAVIATAGKSFSGSYGENMRGLAQTLASKIAINQGTTVQPSSQSTSSEYVDLGLPSGTKWKISNERGYFTYDKAMQYFSSRVPTDRQFQELIDLCDWVWTGKGFNVIGPNNELIFLPACGIRDNGVVDYIDVAAVYLTSTISNLRYNNQENIIVLPILKQKYNELEAYGRYNNGAYSVRLVK